MEPSYAAGSGRGFTLVELIVALAIFATVMAGVAGVFISTLHGSNATRAKLEVVEQFRAVSDFIARDISCAYRSKDLDDCFTFMGGTDRIAFIALTQNFGEDDADLSLISYYLLPDPESSDRNPNEQYKRLIRLAIPMSFEAVEAFVDSYPQESVDMPGMEVPVAEQPYEPDEYFPSDADLDGLPSAYAAYADVLRGMRAPDRLFPGAAVPFDRDSNLWITDDEVNAWEQETNTQLEALFAVLHGLHNVRYGWYPYEWDPLNPDTAAMAPQIDDFELVTLVMPQVKQLLRWDPNVVNPETGQLGMMVPYRWLHPLRFRFGRIDPRDDIGTPDAGPGGYRISPRIPMGVLGRDVGIDNTAAPLLMDTWNARLQCGPPEVVDFNMTFVSKTRTRRDEPLAQPFHEFIYVPMAFDKGSM